MSLQQNITRIKVVYDALGHLAPDVVFVGGATVALYATRPTGEVRPTDDVDMLVELAHHREYAQLEEQLRSKGFVNDIASGVICRYTIRGITVDIMPTQDSALGFSNPWYPEGFRSAVDHPINADYTIRLLRPAYFIATKLAAFLNRGRGDGRLSTDFEDIVFILNNRPAIWREMNTAPEELFAWLQQQVRYLLAQPSLYEWISGHLDYTEQRRATVILGGLEAFVQ